MSVESQVLSADFPRGVRGYVTTAVDEFVQQMGTRLTALQQQLEEQTTRADRLEKELDASQRDLTAFIEKEAAISSALVAIEQRRVGVARELEVERAQTALNAEQTLNEGRQKAESLIQSAQEQAEALLSEAEEARLAQVERLRALCEEYDETVGRIRRALEDQLSLLPAPGTTMSGLSISDLLAVTNTRQPAREEVAEAA